MDPFTEFLIRVLGLDPRVVQFGLGQQQSLMPPIGTNPPGMGDRMQPPPIGVIPPDRRIGINPPDRGIGINPPDRRIGTNPPDRPIGINPPVRRPDVVTDPRQTGVIGTNPPTRRIGTMPPLPNIGTMPVPGRRGIGDRFTPGEGQENRMRGPSDEDIRRKQQVLDGQLRDGTDRMKR